MDIHCSNNIDVDCIFFKLNGTIDFTRGSFVNLVT